MQQKQVNAYFLSTLDYWDAIYRESGVYQTIYQRRRTVALSLVDQLALPAGSRVLEVGCAHGLTTIALAERGFIVEAVDAVPEMISAARIRAQESGLVQRMSFQVADIQNLPFQAGSFDLVLVIGVTEWLRSLEQPLRENRTRAQAWRIFSHRCGQSICTGKHARSPAQSGRRLPETNSSSSPKTLWISTAIPTRKKLLDPAVRFILARCRSEES